MESTNHPSVLLIEPYYAGSHKVLMDLIYEELKIRNIKVFLATLPGKKWHWRARTSALYFAQNIPFEKYTCIFSSCVLPLHELIGIRRDLQQATKIIYFHENQLVYPVRKSKERDFQYGYNQIMSCMAADKVLFNSNYNQESFLSHIQPFFKLQPDCRPKNLRQEIENKCKVIYFPLDLYKMHQSVGFTAEQWEQEYKRSVPLEPKSGISGTLKIVWPHRWEFDKNPDIFFRVIFRLVDEGVTNFRLCVLGENFTDNPPIFAEAQTKLKDFIDHFGYLQSKEDYYKVLYESNVVVSTADHEFFGVSMMEATFLGCFPLCPKKLVYPELYKYDDNLYANEEELFCKLRNLLNDADGLRAVCRHSIARRFNHYAYDWKNLKDLYMDDLLSV